MPLSETGPPTVPPPPRIAPLLTVTDAGSGRAVDEQGAVGDRRGAGVSVGAAKVSVPVPVLVKEIAPPAAFITPANDTLALSPPVVKVAAAPLSVTIPPAPPPSDNEPMVSAKPARSNVAPLRTVTGELEPKAVVRPRPTTGGLNPNVSFAGVINAAGGAISLTKTGTGTQTWRARQHLHRGHDGLPRHPARQRVDRFRKCRFGQQQHRDSGGQRHHLRLRLRLRHHLSGPIV